MDLGSRCSMVKQVGCNGNSYILIYIPTKDLLLPKLKPLPRQTLSDMGSSPKFWKLIFTLNFPPPPKNVQTNPLHISSTNQATHVVRILSPPPNRARVVLLSRRTPLLALPTTDAASTCSPTPRTTKRFRWKPLEGAPSSRTNWASRPRRQRLWESTRKLQLSGKRGNELSNCTWRVWREKCVGWVVIICGDEPLSIAVLWTDV